MFVYSWSCQESSFHTLRRSLSATYSFESVCQAQKAQPTNNIPGKIFVLINETLWIIQSQRLLKCVERFSDIRLTLLVSAALAIMRAHLMYAAFADPALRKLVLAVRIKPVPTQAPLGCSTQNIVNKAR